MIFGTIRITERAVETHRDTYLLSQLSVISVRRPLLPTGLMLSVGATAFGWAFGDLLYPVEIAVLATGACASLAVGWILGQIQLLSRDLRGTELSCMIWGSYGALNRTRRAIFNAMDGAFTRREMGS